MDVTGTVQGKSILLEKPLPGLEGKKVHLRVEPIDAAGGNLSPKQVKDAWKAWAGKGPQGPFEDEDGADWP